MTKHEAVKEYFEQKVIELVDKNIRFNFSPETKDNISIITRYSGKDIKKYINGDSKKEYGFAIIIVKQYSEDLDDLNMESMNFSQAFMDWMDQQNRNKIFPDFGSDCEVEKIENLQNMPNIAEINEKAGLARYVIQGRILYTEKSRQSW